MRNRTVCLVTVAMLLGTAGAALAQSAGDAGPSANIAPTGKHMPAVGQSKSDGVTLLDKKEERKMRRETTICKGC